MRIIIDTNVLISAIWRDKNPEAVILWVISQPDWEWIVSKEIMEEYQNVLHRKKFSFPPETLQKWEAILERDTHLQPVDADMDFPRDPKDAMFLDCAISNHVNYLVTGDADFGEARKVVSTTILSVSMFMRLFVR
jgi:putative PIN family toxin of toxin-antitoxin system